MDKGCIISITHLLDMSKDISNNFIILEYKYDSKAPAEHEGVDIKCGSCVYFYLLIVEDL